MSAFLHLNANIPIDKMIVSTTAIEARYHDMDVCLLCAWIIT